MMSEYYILDGKEVRVAADVLEWGRWFEANSDKRRVMNTEFAGHRISTVFLGLNHQYGNGPPLLFETMVFKGDSYEDLDMDRYSTWGEAEAGHMAMIDKWEARLAEASVGQQDGQ